jgi:hypothetical protein
MRAISKGLITVIFLGLICFQAIAGDIHGKVTDSKTGEPLAGTVISLQGNGRSWHVTAQLDGSYHFKNIPVGSYTITASNVEYLNVAGAHAEIKEDSRSVVTDLLLEPKNSNLANVSLTGTTGSTDVKVRGLEKNAVTFQNILSEKTIQLLPDVTVANALQRVSGVTIQRSTSGEGRYAIIRGMDERYNNTLVNGIKIPSPDSKYRYVPMDLFPSEMLERLEVIKSLTPAMEADAVGGTMNLVMKNAPEHLLVSANASVGMSTLFSSGRPFSAFDHGAVNSQSPAEINGNSYAATQTDFSRGNLNFTSKKTPFNTTAGLTIGDRWLNKKLGAILSVSYQNIYRGSNSDFLVPNAQPQVVNNKDNQFVISDLYTRHYSTQTSRLGLHNKIDYTFAPGHILSLYNMFVQMNEYQTRSTYDSVYLNKLSDNLMRSRLQKQFIYSSTLRGDHKLNERVLLSWIGTYAFAKSQVPDMAEYDYQSSTTPGKYIVQKMSRIWQHNTDKDLAGYLNVLWVPRISSIGPEFNIGGMYRHKTRNNYYNDYSLSPTLSGGLPQYWTDFNSAMYQFSPPSLGTGDVSAANPNTYTSYENVGAGYLQLKLFSGHDFQILGGARIEHTEQGYNTVMPKAFPGRFGQVRYTDLLPSVNLKYSIDQKQNLRASYFRSIVRPDFYEIIPTEIVGELFNIKGNDSLKHSIADNFDIRYEFFPHGADQFLIGAFYKTIENPIEYAVVRNGGPSAQFLMPENFGRARNYGIEAVLTKYIGMFGISANYTYTKSRITTTKQYFYRDPTLGITSKIVQQTRPMQGQADHIGNLSLLYKNPKIGLDIQLAFVYTGKRISQVSPYYQLDYYQLGQGIIDLSFEKRIGRHFSVYGKLNNLSNTPSRTVIYQAPDLNSKFPDQKYNNKTVVGKDIYQLTLLTGVRFKL